MAVEQFERRPTLRERLHRPGFQYYDTQDKRMRIPYKEVQPPDPENSKLTLIFGGFCEIQDPTSVDYTEVLEGFATRGRWPIRVAEPVGKVLAIENPLSIRFATDDLKAIIEFVDKTIPADREIDVVGISQGGVRAVQFARIYPERTHHVGLFVPGGLMNGAGEGEIPKDKKIEFLERTGGWLAEIRKSGEHKFQTTRQEAMREGAQFLGHMFSDPIRAIARAREVVDADTIPDIKQLIENYGTIFTIGAGNYDQLFPRVEIEANLKNRGVIFPHPNIRLVPLETGHNLQLTGEGFANLAIDAMEETERLAA